MAKRDALVLQWVLCIGFWLLPFVPLPAATLDETMSFGRIRTWPRDREVIVISADNCEMKLGTQVLGKIPPKTPLAVLAEQKPFAQVEFEGKKGWVQESQFIRLGKNPPTSEGFCRRGLDALSAGNLDAARMNLFIAVSLDPSDEAYKGLFTSLTELAEKVREGSEFYTKANEIIEHSQKNAQDARMLAGSGFDEKGSLAASRKQNAEQRMAESKAEQDAAKDMYEQLKKYGKSMDDHVGMKVKWYIDNGLVHFGLALADFKKAIVKNPTYDFWVKSGSYTVYENLEKLRQMVTDSNRHCTTAAEARKAGQFAKARVEYGSALRVWNCNKLALEGFLEACDAVERLSAQKHQAEALIRAGRLDELEALAKDVGTLSGDFEDFNKILQQGRQAATEARASLQNADAALKDGRMGDAWVLADRAMQSWKTSPDAARILKAVAEKDAGLATELGKVPELRSKQEYAYALPIIQKLKASHPKDLQLATLEKDLNDRLKEWDADIARAKQLESSVKLMDAFDLFRRRNSSDDVARVAATLAKTYETQEKWERAVAFYELGGKTDDAKRVRQAHAVFGEVAVYSTSEKTGTELFEENANRVCFILVRTDHGLQSGTGFLVSREGHIVTNNHVIGDGAKEVKIRFPDEKNFRPATVIKTVKTPDLALLKTDAAGLAHIPVQVARGVKPKVGSKVYALGFPHIPVAEEGDAAVHSTFTEGTVSNGDRQVMGMSCLQTTASINRGNSGGPLFDSYGRVVGVNTLVIITDELIRDVFFAIQIDAAWTHLLEGIPVEKSSD
jgi:S1-C subfamily serine protease